MRVMRTLALLVFIGLAAAPALAGAEEAAVKDAVVKAYIEGIWVNRDVDAVKAGFHEEFTMYYLADGELKMRSRADWIQRLEERIREEPDAAKPNVRWEFPLVEVTGRAAVVRVELYRDDKHLYTDYLSLYQFDDGWKIVAKIFHSHPR